MTSGAEVEDAHEQEIFEFPWVVFDVSSKQVVDERSLYVKPTLHPQIGVECAEAALGDDAAACMDSAGTLQQAVQVRPWPRRSARERARIAAAARRERKRRANLGCGTGCRTSTTTCTGRSSPTTRTFASSPSRSFQSSAGSGVRGPLCAGMCGVVRTGCVGMGGWACLSAVLRLIPRGWGPQKRGPVAQGGGLEGRKRGGGLGLGSTEVAGAGGLARSCPCLRVAGCCLAVFPHVPRVSG